MEDPISEPKQSTAGRNIFFAVGMLFLVGLVAVMAINMSNVESTDLKDRKAPEFSLTLFGHFEQEQLVLSELRGQVVVVNFWASWCVECYKEAALLEQAWQDYKDQDVLFIGVDYLDTPKEAMAYMAKYNITYPSGPDLRDKIAHDYAITGVPETFFIDKEGNIAHVQIGPIEKGQLYGLLDKLVAQPYAGIPE